MRLIALPEKTRRLGKMSHPIPHGGRKGYLIQKHLRIHVSYQVKLFKNVEINYPLLL